MSSSSEPSLPLRNVFDEEAYLQLHPDVAEAVYAGVVGSAWQHFTLHGFGEGRRWVRKPDRTDGLNQEVAPGDLMYCEDPAHYFDAGESALHCIQAALFAARRPRESITRILDLPCGHGRVMRFLRKAFPAAQITGSDLDVGGLEFCAQTFGAIAVKSHVDPEQVSIDAGFDLIWCGSLMTHLPEQKCIGFMDLFDRLLGPNGILVFTTHGRRCEAELALGTNRCGLDQQQITDILGAYRRTGFGFAEYEQHSGYGFSLVSPPRVLERFIQRQDWRLLSFHENAWDRRQDVVAVQKLPRKKEPISRTPKAEGGIPVSP